jgi:esterase/lipase superfamily enzyme
MMYDIQAVPKSVYRRVGMVGTTCRQLAGTFVNSNFGAVVAFCSIGLLIAINLILRFPDVSTLIMEYNLF